MSLLSSDCVCVCVRIIVGPGSTLLTYTHTHTHISLAYCSQQVYQRFWFSCVGEDACASCDHSWSDCHSIPDTVRTDTHTHTHDFFFQCLYHKSLSISHRTLSLCLSLAYFFSCHLLNVSQFVVSLCECVNPCKRSMLTVSVARYATTYVRRFPYMYI